MSDSFYANILANLTPKEKGMKIGASNVDLTPQSYITTINNRRQKKNLIIFNVGLAVVAVVVCLSMAGFGLASKVSLDNAKSQEKLIEGQLAEFADAAEAIEQQKPMLTKLSQASAGEINWYALISAIESTLPPSTTVSSMGINLDTNQNSERSTAILVSLSSTDPIGYADSLNAFEEYPQISNVNIGGLTAGGEGIYNFSMTFDYDTSIRTYRYNEEYEK